MASTYSALFDASLSQYAAITNASQTGLQLTSNFTLSAWMRILSVQAAEQTILGKILAYSIAVDEATGELLVEYYLEPGLLINKSKVYSAGFTIGTWYHVAVTRATGVVQDTLTFYVNGASIGTDTSGFSNENLRHDTTDFQIGGRDNSSTLYFDGNIDNACVWSRCLSDDEIAKTYKCEYAGDESGLEGYWRFENDWQDETVNENDLTAYGGASFSSVVPSEPCPHRSTVPIPSRQAPGGVKFAND
jgi:hypothetical protein